MLTHSPAFNLAVALVLTDTPVPVDLCVRLVIDGIDADLISAAAHTIQARGLADEWVDAVIEAAGYSRPVSVESVDQAAGTILEPFLVQVIHVYA